MLMSVVMLQIRRLWKFEIAVLLISQLLLPLHASSSNFPKVPLRSAVFSVDIAKVRYQHMRHVRSVKEKR